MRGPNDSGTDRCKYKRNVWIEKKRKSNVRNLCLVPQVVQFLLRLYYYHELNLEFNAALSFKSSQSTTGELINIKQKQ